MGGGDAVVSGASVTMGVGGAVDLVSGRSMEHTSGAVSVHSADGGAFGSSGTVSLHSGDATATGASVPAVSGDVLVATGSTETPLGGRGGASSAVTVATADSVQGTSGDVRLSTGVSEGGVVGSITLAVGDATAGAAAGGVSVSWRLGHGRPAVLVESGRGEVSGDVTLRSAAGSAVSHWSLMTARLVRLATLASARGALRLAPRARQ